ncbi:MAG: helicase-related protein [Kiritimatiellia bacterium]
MAFIANQKDGGKKLGDRLSELLGHSDRLDMLVGFFFFSGVKVIYDALKARAHMKLRVLIGMEAQDAIGALVADASSLAIKERFYESMKRILGSEKVDSQAFHERVGLFAEMIENGRLDIRKTRDPNHAKLYIFTMDEANKAIREKIWITGSSNFSEPGLKLRDELNVEISDFGANEAQQYFDALWEDAVPLTDDEEDRRKLLAILRNASVAADATPYEAYFLVLKTYIDYQKATLNEERLNRLLKEAGFAKYRYQVDAVAQAIRKIEQYNGVIIADVVGLGKSVIGGLVGAMRRRRGLVICPPGLIGTPAGDAGGWYEYLYKFSLKDWKIWSRGDLEGAAEMLKNDPDFDMVIVDEAHNFRNDGTQDYDLLANICFGREVVLLTATPFNNKPGDLLSLMKLFLPAKTSPLGNLEERFRLYQKRYRDLSVLSKELRRPAPDWTAIHKAMEKCGISPSFPPHVWDDLAVAGKECAKRSKKLAGDVRQVMEKVVIRRNRIDLTSDPDYRDEMKTLAVVQAPKEQFFTLSPDQNSFYDRVLNEYFGENGNFHGAIYRPQDYSSDKTGQDDAQLNIYKMLRNQLVQRFESSFGAFRKSVGNVCKNMEKAKAFIERTGCYVYARQLMERLLTFTDDADVYEAINAFAKEQEQKARRGGNMAHRKGNAEYVYRMSDPEFDDKKFLADLDEDMALMRKLAAEVDALKLCENDPKATELCRVVGSVLADSHPDIPAEAGSPRRKVIVFSAYTDTIAHIAKYAEKAFPGRVLAVTGQNFGPQNAKICKENFDASFATQVDNYDILLATDKLSEGFNLNRAGLVVNYDIPWNPTRVIQRVGRINRIGKKVFDRLYIFNFFPTTTGSQYVSNRQVAETKMFAIHRILGEDAQIFSIDEEPKASSLYEKLTQLDDGETLSFYTTAKQAFAKEKAFLEKHHPEVLDRIAEFPSMIKTAWESKKNQPRATLMFKRHGGTFSAIVYSENDREVAEWSLQEAMEQIACSYETSREPFSEEFWQFAAWKKNDPPPCGIYEALKTYRPKGLLAQGGIPDAVEAVNALSRLRARFSSDLKRFALDVAEDIQTYGTIPLPTIKRMASAGRIGQNEEAAGELERILQDLVDLRGYGYLENVRKRATAEAIVVTVQKV